MLGCGYLPRPQAPVRSVVHGAFAANCSTLRPLQPASQLHTLLPCKTHTWRCRRWWRGGYTRYPRRHLAEQNERFPELLKKDLCERKTHTTFNSNQGIIMPDKGTIDLKAAGTFCMGECAGAGGNESYPTQRISMSFCTYQRSQWLFFQSRSTIYAKFPFQTPSEKKQSLQIICFSKIMPTHTRGCLVFFFANRPLARFNVD